MIRRLAFGAASILGFAAGALADEEPGGLRLPQLGAEPQIEARKSYAIPAPRSSASTCC